MKYLIILVIKFYQTVFPKKYRGKCLYKESCSNYVLRRTTESGFKEGMRSFNYRYLNCRSNYSITRSGNEILLITGQFEVVREEEIDERIITMFQKTIEDN